MKRFGSSWIWTQEPEEAGAYNKCVRPLGHPTTYGSVVYLISFTPWIVNRTYKKRQNLCENVVFGNFCTPWTIITLIEKIFFLP